MSTYQYLFENRVNCSTGRIAISLCLGTKSLYPILVSIRKGPFSALGRWDRRPSWPLPSAVAQAGSRRSARRYQCTPPRNPSISLPVRKMPPFRIGKCPVWGFQTETYGCLQSRNCEGVVKEALLRPSSSLHFKKRKNRNTFGIRCGLQNTCFFSAYCYSCTLNPGRVELRRPARRPAKPSRMACQAR